MEIAREKARLVSQSADVYHSDIRRWSRSQLADGMESWWLFQQRHVLRTPGFEGKETEAMRWGTVFHDLVLEHQDIHEGIAIVPKSVLNADGHAKGKPYQIFKELNVGKLVLKEADAFDYVQMWNAIKRNATASELLFDGEDAQNEMGIHWTDEETLLPMRARLDRVVPWEHITDLKTINEASLKNINDEIEYRGYHLQGAMYQTAWKEVTGQVLPYFLVFVQKSMPYTVRTVRLSEIFIERGRKLASRLLRQLKSCLETNIWPDAVDDGYIEMDPPSWVKYSWKEKESE